MFEMFKDSVTLFLQGRLFQDLSSVIRQVAIGAVAAMVILVVLALLGIPMWLAAAISGLAAGAAQPWLFKDLKYA